MRLTKTTACVIEVCDRPKVWWGVHMMHLQAASIPPLVLPLPTPLQSRSLVGEAYAYRLVVYDLEPQTWEMYRNDWKFRRMRSCDFAYNHWLKDCCVGVVRRALLQWWWLTETPDGSDASRCHTVISKMQVYI